MRMMAWVEGNFTCQLSRNRLVAATLALGLAVAAGSAAPAVPGSPSPQADTCGAGMGAGSTTLLYPPGKFPVKLLAVSLLGARNDLPHPYRPGVHWGQLPSGRT